jgi:hypothetical protein
LVYFDDAENDAPPRMIARVSWSDVKVYFQREVKVIAARLGELP